MSGESVGGAPMAASISPEKQHLAKVVAGRGDDVRGRLVLGHVLIAGQHPGDG